MPRPKAKKTSLELAEAHLERVENQIKSCPVDDVPLGLLKERRAANAAVARLRGDAQRLNERTLLKSPAWRRIETAVGAALVPFPEAAKAVVEALRELEARE